MATGRFNASLASLPGRLLRRFRVRAEPTWARRGAIVVLTNLMALLLMLGLSPWVPMQGSPFLLFFAAIMVSAWYGGLLPGIAATLLATLLSKFFFLEPTYQWAIENPGDIVRLGIFVLVSLLISTLSAARRQLVKAVQKERDLISAIVSTAGSLIVVLDRQGAIVQFNRACEQLTGCGVRQVRGRYVWDLFIPTEEVEAVKAIFLQLQSGMFPSEYEGYWLTQDGQRRLITWSNTVLLDDWGQVSYVIGTGLDITDRHQAENELRTTNRALQALVQASPLSITVLDRQGIVKLWNPAAEKIFGWTAEEAIGHPMPSVSEEKLAEFQANIAATLRGDLQNGMETVRRRKDGSLVDVGLWTAVLQGDRPEEDLIMSIVADLSDRKRAEAALKLSQERLTSFVEANIIGILFGDISGGISAANDEFLRMIGYSRQDLETGNLRWTEITPAEFLALDLYHIEEAQRLGACAPYEKEYLCRDGSRIPVLVGFSLMGENRDQAIAFILDLTERKQLEQALRTQTEELEQANRMKDEFLAVLSHELRTPLNSMLGWSQLLQTRQFDPQTTRRALETIERNARLQTQLINDILDVSKIIRGKLRLHTQPLDLAPLIQAALETMRPAAEAKSIALEVQISPTTIQVLGDADRLQQVIWNLISNAIKFTAPGGRVQITLDIFREPLSLLELPPHRFTDSGQLATDYAQIQVIDTGKGINPDFLPFVFDRFRQADSTTTRSDGGLGLGLAIVRHLVELHGGSVTAASTGLGKGSTFTVRLPLLLKAYITQSAMKPPMGLPEKREL